MEKEGRPGRRCARGRDGHADNWRDRARCRGQEELENDAPL